MQIDPRTVARDIPGIFDEIFPQLTSGAVLYLNTQAVTMPVSTLTPAMLNASTLQRAMLFELAYSVADNILTGKDIDWPACTQATLERQRVYFDAVLPEQFDPADMTVAELVGRNLANSLNKISTALNHRLMHRPHIPGFQWIGNGNGDFAVNDTLIEVKSTAKRFSSSDYRQVAIYWLLSYLAAIEGRGTEWAEFILLNPRDGTVVRMKFDQFLSVISSGRTKIEILQVFQSLVGTRRTL